MIQTYFQHTLFLLTFSNFVPENVDFKIFTLLVCVHVFVFLCICIYVSVSVHMCVLYACLCVFVCVYICLCVYIFTCMNLKSKCKVILWLFWGGTLPNFLRKGISLNQELKQFSYTSWLVNPASFSLMLRIESFGTLWFLGVDYISHT